MRCLQIFAPMIILILLLGFHYRIHGESEAIHNYVSDKNLVFALCVNNNSDVKKAELLLKSLNQFGGKYSHSKFFIVCKDISDDDLKILKNFNTEFLPLQIDSSAVDYPFAHKAYACAQVEKIVSEQKCDLVWLDNECLILSRPDELVLPENKYSAFRPVFLLNTVGQDASTKPDVFWSRIYDEAKMNFNTVPEVETFVDWKKIRFYINCQVITVNPKLGIFREWEKIFTKLLKDGEYQKSACADPLHQIFLHQAVLSAVLTSRIKPEGIHFLSNNYGYPIHLHEKIPAAKRLSVNDVKILLYENIFSIKPNWLDDYDVKETLKRWIIRNRE